jgi:hypothetical protein
MSGLALGALALIVSGEDDRRCSEDTEAVLMGRVVTMAGFYRSIDEY